MPEAVVLDTSVLLNLCQVDRLDLLGAIRRYRFVTPTEVDGEVLWPIARSRLTAGYRRGDLTIAGSGETAILERIGDLLGRGLDLGESACLALAEIRGWIVACDERRRFLRIAEDVLGPGRLMDTPGLLLTAIAEELLDVAEADAIKAELEERRFVMRFASFRDLVR